jgi:putative hemolysin
MLLELGIVMLLILANGVLSGAEIAVVTVRKSRIQTLVAQRHGGAIALDTLRRNPERFLATVQIGITVVATTTGAFGGAAVAAHLEPLLRALPGMAEHAHDVSLGLVVAAISYLSLVCGELVPKSLALRAAEPYALFMSRILLVLAWLARPLVWLLTRSSNLLLRPFADRTTFTESRLSKEEIQQIVDEAAKTGALDEHTQELTSRALQFETLTGADIMIPRNRIVALPRRASQETIRRTLLEERRSRMPVFDGSLDNIVGYVSAKDLLPLAWEGKLIVLEDVLRPVKMFIETTPALQLLQFMQRERQRLAIMIDEHGAVAGLIAFEDLAEELAGEFFSETDRKADPIAPEANGSWLVRGEATIRDVKRETDIELEEPEEVTSIAGLCDLLAGGVVPARGARLACRSGAVLEVLDSSSRAVRRVRLVPPPPRPATAPVSGS